MGFSPFIEFEAEVIRYEQVVKVYCRGQFLTAISGTIIWAQLLAAMVCAMQSWVYLWLYEIYWKHCWANWAELSKPYTN